MGKPITHFEGVCLLDEEIKTVKSEDFLGKGKSLLICFMGESTLNTQISQLQYLLGSFEEYKASVVCVSTDTIYNLQAKSKLSVDEGGIVLFDFPLVSDYDHQISSKFESIYQESGSLLNACFLVNSNGIIEL